MSYDPNYEAGRRAGQNGGNIPPKPVDADPTAYERQLRGYKDGQK